MDTHTRDDDDDHEEDAEYISAVERIGDSLIGNQKSHVTRQLINQSSILSSV